MNNDRELTDDELEELLVQKSKHQPAKCRMKTAVEFIKSGRDRKEPAGDGRQDPVTKGQGE